MTPEYAIRQLRHLYQQMLNGHVRDTVQAAKGLLGPAIVALEPIHTPTEECAIDWRARALAAEAERDEALALLKDYNEALHRRIANQSMRDTIERIAAWLEREVNRVGKTVRNIESIAEKLRSGAWKESK